MIREIKQLTRKIAMPVMMAAVVAGCGNRGEYARANKPAGDPKIDECKALGGRVIDKIAAERNLACVGGGIIVFRQRGEIDGADTKHKLTGEALLNKIGQAEEKARADYFSHCIKPEGVLYGLEYMNILSPCKGGEFGYFTVTSVAVPKEKME
ncbi:MAG: hypothetical protein WC772_05310 [Candidatus Margulisiibacteriota bacterium]|jgi:hypothetical protein